MEKKGSGSSEIAFPIISPSFIERRIYLIRKQKVMLARDFAELYGVKPIRLRAQVKRNRERFPEDFMFQLNDREVDIKVSQNAIPSRQHLGGSLQILKRHKKSPFVQPNLHYRSNLYTRDYSWAGCFFWRPPFEPLNAFGSSEPVAIVYAKEPDTLEIGFKDIHGSESKIALKIEKGWAGDRVPLAEFGDIDCNKRGEC